MSRFARGFVICASLLGAGCDSNTSYPFVGQWVLDETNKPGICGFIPSAKITRTHVVVPLNVLTITDVKNDKGRWIISGTGTQGASPPVVIKDVTAQSIVIADVAGIMACKMKKVGECSNLLCD